MKTQRKKSRSCDCIFCSSKCPECKSTNIHVRYSVTWEYENYLDDQLDLDITDFQLELHCNNCGAEFSQGDFDGFDSRLESLSKALWERLGLASTTEITHAPGGEIKTEAYETRPFEEEDKS